MVPTGKVVYKIFGIPLWSVTKIVDVDKIYDIMSERFAKEMADLTKKVRGEDE